ncbi:hypothetical protein, conserved [Eimeria tenella]|uniref:Uncharacterized protein n=1 Tax=Eimeria tenella TaxID=5802 RepID=U6KYE2_EIMTE|nr:hypothetical protein, conserved [Eimeria tenella]CDJ42971.1 hypothetical protein, conserved [Eimeria tenella]|eukprot:XP_013233721.1 hypothetical protein, conserved [Eimeria tenella]
MPWLVGYCDNSAATDSPRCLGRTRLPANASDPNNTYIILVHVMMHWRMSVLVGRTCDDRHSDARGTRDTGPLGKLSIVVRVLPSAIDLKLEAASRILACAASQTQTTNMSPAEAEPPRHQSPDTLMAGEAAAAAKSATLSSAAISRNQETPGTAAPVGGEESAMPGDAVEANKAQGGAGEAPGSGSSTVANAASGNSTASSLQTAPVGRKVADNANEDSKNVATNRSEGDRSTFIDVLQHDLNAAVQRVEAGRLLLERLRGALLQQAAAASTYAASLNSAAATLKPLSSESRTCAAAVESYSCLLGSSALQAKELSDALRRDVVASTLDRTIENHAQVLKQVARAHVHLSLNRLAAGQWLVFLWMFLIVKVANGEWDRAEPVYLHVPEGELKRLCLTSHPSIVVAYTQAEACTVGNEFPPAIIYVYVQVKVDAAEAQRRNHLAAVEHQRAMEKYLRCSKLAVAAAETAQASLSLLPSTKTELALQCIRLSVEARQAEEAYVIAVQALQQRSAATRDRVRSILSCLEEMDLKRMQCLKDALTRAGVFVAANLRHMQYDLERCIQSVEGVDPESDLREFVDERRLQTHLNVSLPTVEKWTVLDAVYGDSLQPAVCNTHTNTAATPLSSATSVARQLLQKSPLQRVVQSAASLAAYSIGVPDTSAAEAPDKQVRAGTEGIQGLSSPPDDAVLQRLREDYSGFINALWTPVMQVPGKGVLLPAETCALLLHKMPLLQEELTSSLHRNVFLSALVATKRKKAEEMPDRQALLPSMLQLRLLGASCEWLLTAADTQLDAWSGRQLLLLAVEIAAPGSAADDPQQHQHWDWHEALILQQQLNSEDYPNATSESLELGKQCAQPSIGTSGNSGSIGNQNDACKEDREPPTVRWSLHRCVYHHRYWNRVTFWEEALALTVSEELQRQKLSEKWQAAGPEVLQQQEKLFREKNPCCSSLPSFGSFMSLYGIATEQVHSLLLSVSKHLNLDEQTSEMLLHGVSGVVAPQNQLPASSVVSRRGSNGGASKISTG